MMTAVSQRLVSLAQARELDLQSSDGMFEFEGLLDQPGSLESSAFGSSDLESVLSTDKRFLMITRANVPKMTPTLQAP